MKSKRVLWSIIFVFTLAILAGCGGNSKEEETQEGGSKAHVSIVLVDKDGTEYPYEIDVTEGVPLRDALLEGGLITEETYYSMFVDNIDGHIADAVNEGVTWVPCDADGNQIVVEADEEDMDLSFGGITVKDGDFFKLVYTVVPDAD